MNSGVLIALAAILLAIWRLLFAATTDLVTWFGYARSVLEVLYYISGIAIAVAAFWGLRQLTISKQIAKVNAKREAYKLAADECRHFADVVVPARTSLDILVRDKHLQSFTNKTFSVETGEIKNRNFDMGLLTKEIAGFGTEIVACLNALEAFAIFFASGVADEDIGYRETGRAFCESARISHAGNLLAQGKQLCQI